MLKKELKRWLGDNAREKLSNLKYAPMNLYCSLYPMKKEIILESHPDLTCNTFQLFRYMLEQHLNQQYKLTWMVNNPNDFSGIKIDNVEFINITPKNKKEKRELYVRCNRAVAIITSNRHRGKMCSSKRQVNIYLDHGSQLKKLANDTERKIVSCDYLLCQSPFFIPYNLSQYLIAENQIFCAGLPRNDQLFQKHDSIKKLFSDIADFKKIILWVPTFRQHMSKVRTDCDISYPLGMPITYSESDTKKINSVLEAENMLLIVKPHPAQNLEIIKDMKCSHIRFIYNENLKQYNIQLNELLEQTDAMITDYSSIYYDYLLLDRPIGITLDDYEIYSRQKGFVFENVLDILKGDYLYTIDDMCEFVKNVSSGNDRTLAARIAVKNVVHSYVDDKSTKRVYDFIMEKLNK